LPERERALKQPERPLPEQALALKQPERPLPERERALKQQERLLPERGRAILGQPALGCLGRPPDLPGLKRSSTFSPRLRPPHNRAAATPVL